MTERERNAMPKVGPRFFREAGEVMFEFVIDHGNIIGPRPATKADSEKHPVAWGEFVAPQLEPVVKPEPVIAPRELEPEALAALDRLEAEYVPSEVSYVEAAAEFAALADEAREFEASGIFVTKDGAEHATLAEAAAHVAASSEPKPKRAYNRKAA